MSKTAWKVLSLVGLVFVLVGASAGYIDIATNFRFEWISDQFAYFILSLLVGTIAVFIGSIGWARFLDRPSRVRMAVLAFSTPWIIGLLGYPIAGFNVHGPAPLVLLLVGVNPTLLSPGAICHPVS